MNLHRVTVMALLILFVAGAVSDAANRGGRKKTKPVRAKITSLDASAKTITVKMKKEAQEKTLDLADAVKVKINGEDKALSDVEPGVKARLRLSEDGQTVKAIIIGKRKKNQ